MKIIAVIPARLEATRFPKKLIQDLSGKPVLVRTYEQVVNTNLFDEVLIATDAQEIQNMMQAVGAKVFMSQNTHESGSDRIAEAIKDLPIDVVINIQGDEPFIDELALTKMVEFFKQDQQNTAVCSLMTPIKDPAALLNLNVVKVVTSQLGKAMYFSRSCIPFVRDNGVQIIHYQHIGVYGFRKQALLEFTQLPESALEKTEKLEQLRYLDYGKSIQMIVTEHQGIGIDTPEDLVQARLLWEFRT